MKELLIGILFLGLTVGTLYASSVTAIDKNNVIVTNDAGTNAYFSMQQLNSTVSRAMTKASLDQQALVYDQEVALSWMQVYNQAVNAVNSIQ